MGSKNVDRLSNMPEEILSEILSLMPTKYAVQTSILSKRWRYNWTLVTNIDINVHPFHGLLNCCAFVDRVLDLCKTTEIKLFRLRFSNLWVQKSRLTKWIDEAVRLNVRELDIQSGLLKLPLSLLTCKTLTKLTIESNNSCDGLDRQTPFNLPCLKTIDITVFGIGSRNALKLIRGCPVLESFSLQMIHCSEEEECRFDIATLKHLKLKTWKWGSFKKVVLNVPNLEDLTIGGRWGSPFVMEDLSSLVSLKDLPDEPLLNMPNLKHLELTDDGYKFEQIIIFKFLESCSELEHLSIKTAQVCWTNEPDSCWFKPHLVLLKTLRTMKYENCKWRKDDIKFLEYMLRNAEVLKTLTITYKSERMEEEMRLCAKLLKCPRASRYCEIHFVGKSFESASS
ncbi:FBD-like protein [Artemisia annua]|uniref:FBD-like protein n=1 Tax=Artemisia annua TaxID=35608 RepID=A0A2U1N7F7_ARTAN|nr:FBD-like protein [Artemisia annua]